jgi:tRNA pseudouridine13 synthase
VTKDGINVDKMRHTQKDFSMAGGYRRMIELPYNLESEILYYNDFKDALTLTDLQILEKQPPIQNATGTRRTLI